MKQAPSRGSYKRFVDKMQRLIIPSPRTAASRIVAGVIDWQVVGVHCHNLAQMNLSLRSASDR
jgi:hypothetical protein